MLEEKTANIGSMKNIEKLLSREAKFQSYDEFNEFWRYNFSHGDALKRIKKIHSILQHHIKPMMNIKNG